MKQITIKFKDDYNISYALPTDRIWTYNDIYQYLLYRNIRINPIILVMIPIVNDTLVIPIMLTKEQWLIQQTNIEREQSLLMH